MKKIIMLVDYKNNFTSKYDAVPYRSGMDKEILKKYFIKNGYEIVVRNFSDINFREDNLNNIPIIYPSSEDNGRYYKRYIEDIILGLELKGAKVIPSHNYLIAHDNKVFMEILRDISILPELKSITSRHFGTYEEFNRQKDHFTEDRYVIKATEGAMSRGVELSKDRDDLIDKVKLLSSTKDLKLDTKDKLRHLKHSGYIEESRHRKKFIIQNFIPNLRNDWKIVIFGDVYYIIYRGTKENDFRASGSGKLLMNDELILQDGIFDFAKKVFDSFNTPTLSLDVMFDGKEFHVVEFQFLYFGTGAHCDSDSYFKLIDNRWERVFDKLEVEEVYVNSIVNFLEKNNYSI
jgi:glutathione synthase/RimK-type ligase-like ATP-grasp enzyme